MSARETEGPSVHCREESTLPSGEKQRLNAFFLRIVALGHHGEATLHVVQVLVDQIGFGPCRVAPECCTVLRVVKRVHQKIVCVRFHNRVVSVAGEFVTVFAVLFLPDGIPVPVDVRPPVG